MYTSFNARAVGLPTLPAAETIEVAASAGFRGVDLMVRDLLDAGDDPAALRRRMDDLGLRGGAFPLPVAWKGDAESYRRDLARLPRLAEAAEQLGLTRTGTWVLPETPERFDDPGQMARHRGEIVDLHRRRLGAIARTLEGHGIRLGLEFIGVDRFRTRRGEPFVVSTADLLDQLRPIFDEHPNVGLLVDVFHLYAAGDSIDEAIAAGIEKVAWVHVADLPAGSSRSRFEIVDESRGLPFDNGAVPVAGDLRKVADAGYDGPVTAEPLSRCESLIGRPPDEVARIVMESLETCWPDFGLRGRR